MRLRLATPADHDAEVLPRLQALRLAGQEVRLYLSGPMTGLPEHNYQAFAEAAHTLRQAGIESVVSPHELAAPNCDGCLEHEHHDIHDWQAHMREDIIALMGCDTIVMLPGWQSSKGAKLEMLIGMELGYKICDYVDGKLVKW